ncbi:hypothetical protein [Roseinatronobacter sp. NSM]|uniref:hypothetical protein n=1 Tax=Roseinatronobacter sp. NSM TaxID=3457785 RepID=UPI0040373FE1
MKTTRIMRAGREPVAGFYMLAAGGLAIGLQGAGAQHRAAVKTAMVQVGRHGDVSVHADTARATPPSGPLRAQRVQSLQVPGFEAGAGAVKARRVGHTERRAALRIPKARFAPKFRSVRGGLVNGLPGPRRCCVACHAGSCQR